MGPNASVSPFQFFLASFVSLPSLELRLLVTPIWWLAIAS